LKIKDLKKYDRFENCKGLSLRKDPEDLWAWYDPFPTDRYSYAYFVIGFSNLYIIYDYQDDKVLWYQKGVIRAKGKSVWDSMNPGNRKLFLFDMDWFLGK